MTFRRKELSLTSFFLVIADDATPLAQKDFHLFGPLKDALRGSRFEDDESVILAVRGYVNRKRAGTGKACVPLFRAGVRP